MLLLRYLSVFDRGVNNNMTVDSTPVVRKWPVRTQSDLWTLTSFGNTFPVNNDESYLRG